MGLSFKNLTHPSQWDLTGDVGAAEDLRDAITGKTGAEAAKAREEAARKAAAEGRGYIDEGTAGATAALGTGYADAQGALGQGRDSALDALLNGSNQAAGAI